MFQVTQYKTFQILVQTFPEPWARGSPSVFHFRNRQRFQVPGFEWVHELLLFCLASNPAQFCAEISCGKTGLGHNCTISISRMKNDFSVCRRGALVVRGTLNAPATVCFGVPRPMPRGPWDSEYKSRRGRPAQSRLSLCSHQAEKGRRRARVHCLVVCGGYVYRQGGRGVA